jgi:hypothetical protein
MMEHTVSGIHLEKYIVRKSNWKKKMSQLKIITQNNKIACSLLSILLYTITHIVYIYINIILITEFSLLFVSLVLYLYLLLCRHIVIRERWSSGRKCSHIH